MNVIISLSFHYDLFFQFVQVYTPLSTLRKNALPNSQKRSVGLFGFKIPDSLICRYPRPLFLCFFDNWNIIIEAGCNPRTGVRGFPNDAFFDESPLLAFDYGSFALEYPISLHPALLFDHRRFPIASLFSSISVYYED